MNASPKVYFAQTGSDGPIKIGFTTGDANSRIAALQTGCPWTIRLVGVVTGTPQHEAWLHARFSEHKISGEWFAPASDVLAAIAEILAPGFEWPLILRASRTGIRGPLATWLAEHRLSPAEFGKLIGRSQVAVCRYINGVRIPDREAMIAIYLTTNGAVQPNHFYALPPLLLPDRLPGAQA